MTDNLITFSALLFILLAVGASAIRIVVEYERVVVFTLGRFTGVKGPGLIFIIPFVQTLSRVDLRTIVLDVPTQDLISRDNVSVHVNAVIYFKVVDPERAIIQVEQFIDATSQLAQTTLRSVLGKHELDEMLTERDKLNKDIQEIIDTQTTSWGIKVANVEIKHVDIDESMVRAMAKQAEAERERRARVINAEGEQQAASKSFWKLQKRYPVTLKRCNCVILARLAKSLENAVPQLYFHSLLNLKNFSTGLLVKTAKSWLGMRPINPRSLQARVRGDFQRS